LIVTDIVRLPMPQSWALRLFNGKASKASKMYNTGREVNPRESKTAGNECGGAGERGVRAGQRSGFVYARRASKGLQVRQRLVPCLPGLSRTEFVIADKEAFSQQRSLSQRTAPTSVDEIIVVLADNGHTVKKVVVSTELFREPVGVSVTYAKVEVKYGSYDPQQADKWITYIGGYLDGWDNGRSQGWQSGYSEAWKTASK
jgi:hypothetical protein